jgi:hypothetical protein
MAMAIGGRGEDSRDRAGGVQSCRVASTPQLAFFLLAAAALWCSLLTPSAAQTCCGDCDTNGQVMVDEVITAVNIALGNSGLNTCDPADDNGDGQVTIDEVLAAVSNALNGCPIPAGLVRFWIGEIPDQAVWQGGRIQFLVAASGMPLATLAVQANPQPHGTMLIERVSGSSYWVFQYVPDASDKADFTVTVTAADGGATTSQSFVISPQPILRAEQTVFGTTQHTGPPITTYETEHFEVESLLE